MMGEKDYNFGYLPQLPQGYRVAWYECHEHYQATGPDDWESPITYDPFQARRWCFLKAKQPDAAGMEVS